MIVLCMVFQHRIQKHEITYAKSTNLFSLFEDHNVFTLRRLRLKIYSE
jgi:hypothetical protein